MGSGVCQERPPARARATRARAHPGTPTHPPDAGRPTRPKLSHSHAHTLGPACSRRPRVQRVCVLMWAPRVAVFFALGVFLYAAMSAPASSAAPSKRPRVTPGMLSGTGVTKAQVANVMKALHKQGLLVGANDGELSERAFDKAVFEASREHGQQQTPYGTVIQETDEIRLRDGKKWTYVHPMAWLYYATSLVPPLGDLVSKMSLNGSRVLNVIVYADEAEPGNPFRSEKSRQLMCIYWSFLEFPSWFWNKAQWWPFIGMIQMKSLNEISGGLGRLMRFILRLFWPESGFSFKTGVMAVVGDANCLVRSKFGGFLADLAAHKLISNTKGTGGLRSCSDCRNLVQGRDTAGNAYFITNACTKYSKLDRHTNATIWELVDELARAHTDHENGILNKGELRKMQTHLGYNFDADGLLSDAYLRQHVLAPAEQRIVDWMHTLCSEGLANVEMALIIHELKTHGVKAEHLQKFSLQVHLPKSQNKVSEWWFHPHRIKKDHVVAFAAETASMVRIFDMFLQDVILPTGVCNDHVRCFGFLARIVDLCSLGKDASVRYFDVGRAAIEAHHALFVELFQHVDLAVKPKFHQLMHIFDHAWLLSCWVTERKHKLVIDKALRLMHGVETTLAHDLLTQQIEGLLQNKDHLFTPSKLIRPSRTESAPFPALLTSNAVDVETLGRIDAGDLVCFASGKVGKALRFHQLQNSSLLVYLEVYHLVKDSIYSTERFDNAVEEVVDIVDKVLWYAPVGRPNRIRVYAPFQLRVGDAA